MKFEFNENLITEECQKFCIRVADGTHDSPKETSIGKRLVTSKNIKNSRLDLSGAYLISEYDFGEINKRSKVDQWDLLLTMIGTVGEVCLVTSNQPDFAIKNVGLLKCGDEIRAKWLYYFLISRYGKALIEERKKGSTQQYISLGEIRSLPITYPKDKLEMHRLVEFISMLDDRITLLRETNKTLEAIAQAIFKSWFIDFDPVRTKMEGRVPARMDVETAALFPDELVESELGLIPKGWEVGSVKDLGEVICGKTPSTSVQEYFGGDVPFITIPDMHNTLVITSTNRTLSLLGANSQSNKTLPPGSVCVSCIATPGLVVMASVPSQTNQQINSVIPMNKWGKSFVLFALRRIGEAVRVGGSGGSVFHNLNKSGFEKLNMLLPTENLAVAFNVIIEPLVEKIKGNQLHIETLEQLRDTLLPRLISGRLKLVDVVAEAG